MKGCPLRCLWCDNPEGQSPTPQLMVFQEKCINCGRCLEICSQHALDVIQDKIAVEWDLCNNCGKCSEVCDAEALKVVGKSMDVEEVMAEILKDRLFYRESEGGVTIGGGEPSMQSAFVSEVLKRCHELYINTAIETCGYASWNNMKKILSHTDQLFFDIKHMDSFKHKELTGFSNKIILENAKRASHIAGEMRMIIRIPTIPGFNSSHENIANTAKFVANKLKNVQRVELLPYHSLGEPKYHRIGLDYKLSDIKPPTKERMKLLKELVETFGLECHII